jgi:hypothetical protein
MESTINDYRVVEAKTTESLTKVVMSLVANRWEPIGGVAVAANRVGVGIIKCTFYQAMVRRAPKPPAIPKY